MSLIKFSFEGSKFELTPVMAARLFKQDKFCREHAFATKGCCTCPDKSVEMCNRFSQLLSDQLQEYDDMLVASEEEFPVDVE